AEDDVERRRLRRQPRLFRPVKLESFGKLIRDILTSRELEQPPAVRREDVEADEPSRLGLQKDAEVDYAVPRTDVRDVFPLEPDPVSTQKVDDLARSRVEMLAVSCPRGRIGSAAASS